MNSENRLQEKVAAALSASVGGWNQNTAIIQRSAAAMLPIIRAEVAKARAEALREAAERFFYDGDRDHTMHGYALLHHAADEHEAEQNDV